MPDRDAPRQLLQLLGSEAVLDEAHRAVREQTFAVARHDPRRLLTAMLQGV